VPRSREPTGTGARKRTRSKPTLIARVTSRTWTISVMNAVHSDRVSAPWATVPPNGPSFAARSGSTWIHWWSPVRSANVSIRAWSISCQPEVPSSSRASRSSMLSKAVIRSV
jgi:hypothetical protein